MYAHNYEQLPNVEPNIEGSTFRVDSFARVQGHYHARLMDQFVHARTTHIEDKGWLDLSGVDVDIYDFHPATTYIFASDVESGGNLLAGMRMTRVEDFLGSLTYSMLDGTVEGCEDVTSTIDPAGLDRLRQLSADSMLWDITRFIVNPEYTRDPNNRGKLANIGPQIIRMFGKAMEVSEKAIADRTELNGLRTHYGWVFLSEPNLYDFLKDWDIQCDQLYKGKISPDDETDSILGLIQPGLQYSSATERTLRYINEGLTVENKTSSN